MRRLAGDDCRSEPREQVLDTNRRLLLVERSETVNGEGLNYVETMLGEE